MSDVFRSRSDQMLTSLSRLTFW